MPQNAQKRFFINSLEFPDKIDKEVRLMLPLMLDVIRVFQFANRSSLLCANFFRQHKS